MIFTSHLVTGAALAQLVPNHPIVAFGLGVASHFVLDQVPHWDYWSPPNERGLSYLKKGGFVGVNWRVLLPDAAKAGSDLLIGILGVLLIIYLSSSATFQLATWLGAFGGVFPDLFHVFYVMFPYGKLKKFFDFHTDLQAKISTPGLGMVNQIGVVILSALLIWLFLGR